MNSRCPARGLLAGLAALLAAGCAQVPTLTESAPAESPVVVVVVQAPAPVPAAEPRVAQPEAPAPVALPEVIAPPPPPPDVWVRIRGGFQMTNLNGPLVQQWEQWYSTRPDYVARMVGRGSHFLYHVMEELERRKMPAEIALLPMIESAYNPEAYSRAHAAGMWQFIPSTGRHYGLRQNFWYDGRRDVLAATDAALDYLEKLYKQFNDWNLALAAYNWGEGAVSRAMAKNAAKGLPTDYENLAMPAETRNYLPKLQAVKNIIAKPDQYGIKLVDVPNRPYFATVTTPQHIDVKVAATLAEISLDEFRFLNPAHNKPVIRASAETIVLPVDKVLVFQRNLTAHQKPLVSWQAYTVKRSDKPEQIAARHGMSLAKLKEANGIPARKRIVAGQTLMVPLKGSAEPYLPDLPAPKVTLVRSKKATCYQTRKGVKKAVACASSKKKKKTTTVKAPPSKKTTVASQSR